MIVGGFAVIQQGLPRTTEDVDLLLDSSRDNQERVKRALCYLPDQAVRELGDEDLAAFVVVRVADDILVNLMFRARGIDYAEAAPETEVLELQGVPIPFASAKLLWRMKQTVRQKDEVDRIFLREKLGIADPTGGKNPGTVPPWLWRLTLALALASFAAVVLLAAILLGKR